MGKVRIKREADEDAVEYYAVYPHSCVDRILRGAKPGSRVLVHGADPWDEFVAYAAKTRPSSLLVNKRPAFPFVPPVQSRAYWRRLDMFLQTTCSPRDLSCESVADALELAEKLRERDAIRVIGEKYARIKSNRYSVDAPLQVQTYVMNFLAKDVSGPCVFYIDHLNWRAVLAMMLWHKLSKQSPLIVLAPDDFASEISTLFDRGVEQEYIPVQEFVASTSDTFGMPVGTVLRALEKFENNESLARRFGALDSDKLTLSACDGFLDAFPFLVGEQVTDVSVPAQAAAPLRFSMEEGRIDLLESREYAKDDPLLLGAARGALSQANDLTAYPGFNNAVPNFDRRLERITDILGRVADGNYDDSLIVQLGTELIGLESLINAARDRLGESAHAEAAAFFAVMKGFLNQYAAWSDYSAHAAQHAPRDSIASYEVATLILRDLSLDLENASQRVRTRILEYMVGLNGNTALQRAGAISSVENVVASAAGQLVRASRDAAKRTGEKVVDKLSDKASDAAVRYIAKNYDRILAFAQKSAIPWLADLFKHLGSP